MYRGTSGRRSVALTFDDGPSESTPVLLEVLHRHNVNATFFLCGANVERCPAVAREIRALGHEVGNHTFSHPRLDFHSARFIYEELSRAQTVIQQATGISPQWFRAPYGVRWFGLRQAQRRLGLKGAMWTPMARDWRLPTKGIVDRILSGVEPGAMFCLHDGRGLQVRPDVRSSIEAVELVVPKLLDLGYRFETVSQLASP